MKRLIIVLVALILLQSCKTNQEKAIEYKLKEDSVMAKLFGVDLNPKLDNCICVSTITTEDSLRFHEGKLKDYLVRNNFSMDTYVVAIDTLKTRLLHTISDYEDLVRVYGDIDNYNARYYRKYSRELSNCKDILSDFDEFEKYIHKLESNIEPYKTDSIVILGEIYECEISRYNPIKDKRVSSKDKYYVSADLKEVKLIK